MKSLRSLIRVFANRHKLTAKAALVAFGLFKSAGVALSPAQRS